jgi:hypothetical protein
MPKKKKNAKKYSLLFICILFVLIFFSESYAASFDLLERITGKVVGNLYDCKNTNCFAGEHVKINIEKGWNLVPFFETESQITQNSQIKLVNIKKAYLYIPELKRYVEIFGSQMQGDRSDAEGTFRYYVNKAMWIYSDIKGILEIEISNNFLPLASNESVLIKGWNLYTITPDFEKSAIEDVVGDCEIKQIYTWNSVIKGWSILKKDIFLDKKDIWKAILIKVNDDCKLNKVEVISPPLLLDLSEEIKCEEYKYSNWSVCVNGTKTRTLLSRYPENCTEEPDIKSDCLPACREKDWRETYVDEGCRLDGKKIRIWVKKINCESGVEKPLTEEISCNPSLPKCTSFTYSNWSACSQNSIQSREIISRYPENCAESDVVLTQECNYVPLCTENNWQSSINPSSCPDNRKQIKTWSKIGNCENGVFKNQTETIVCSYTIPQCTYFAYSDWSICDRSGVQNRNVLTKLPENCIGGSPLITQKCAPPCTEGDWMLLCYYEGKTYGNINQSCPFSPVLSAVSYAIVLYLTMSRGMTMSEIETFLDYNKINYSYEWVKKINCESGVEKPKGLNYTSGYAKNDILQLKG